jgi:hypothetical protein
MRSDLQRAVVHTVAGTWQAWHLVPETGEITRTVSLEDAPPEISWICFSRAGDLVAMAPATQPETIRFWNATTGRCAGTPLTGVTQIQMFTGSGPPPACFSPDGRLFVAGSMDGVVSIWDTTAFQLLARLPPHRDSAVNRLQISADGTRLATRNRRGEVLLWETPTGRPACALPADTGNLGYLAFSPLGERLLTWSDGGTARVWDGHTGAIVSEPMVHAGVAIRWAAFSRDGQRVVTAATDGTARVWDARTGAPLTDPMPHEVQLTTCSFSPDGRFVLTSPGRVAGVPPRYCIWSVPPAPLDATAPEWLLGLATVYAQRTINDAGLCVDAPEIVASIDQVRRNLAVSPDDAPFVAWGRWILDDRADRPIAPGFTITPAEAEALARRLEARELAREPPSL